MTPSLVLQVPARVTGLPGASVDVQLALQRTDLTAPITLSIEGLPEGVSAKFTPETVTASSSTLTLTLTATAAPGSLTLKASGGGVEQVAPLQLVLARQLSSPTSASPITVTLNQLFYADGDRVTATVDFGTHAVPAAVPDLVFSSGDSRDAERLPLVKSTGNTWRTEGELKVATQAMVAGDGTLQLAAGNLFFAFYAVDHADPALADVEATLLSDFGFMDGPASGAAPSRVDARFALNPEEAMAPRATGTLLKPASLPVQIAARELILTASSNEEVSRFLAFSGGTVVDEQPLDEAGTLKSVLVAVSPSSMSPERTSRLRAFVHDDGELISSSADALGVYGLALMARLEGFAVSVNPRLQPDGAPTVAEQGNLSANMENLGVFGSGTCVPNSTTNPCVRSVPAVWAYLSLMDRDTQRIRFGILDYGFAPNDDFRRDVDGGFQECDLTARPPRCGPGAAGGIPTVRGSGVGAFVWHGTGGVTAIAGIVNDGFGGAGVGGQVGVPMLYKYDTVGFVFDIGRGVRMATDQGASCINISAGYPCGVVTTVGPDLDLCTVGGRLSICAVVSASATAAAVAFCTSPLVGVPIAGVIICGALTTAAITVTGACVSSLGVNFALGNPGGPMRAAISYARQQGVPVVVSAGNVLSRDSLPEVIRDYVNLDERRTERWNIIPANFPEPITSGAANEALDNQEFFGNRVDLWAPIFTSFFAPSSVTDPASPLARSSASGTSAAAPYIVGTILAMQAANPDLNPHAPGTTALMRANNVERIRGLLRSTAWTNAQLVTMGFSDQPQERRLLINPLGAVQAAARGVLPDLAALGYDTSLNFSDDGRDDTRAGARALLTTPLTGTILSIAPSRGVTQRTDSDWFTFAGSPDGFISRQELRLRWLGSDRPAFDYNRGSEFVEQVSVNRVGEENIGVYRFYSRQATASLAVTASAGDDFPYELRLVGAATAPPATVLITEPVVDASSRFCVGESVRFAAEAFYPSTGLHEAVVAWSVDGLSRLSGATMSASFNTAGPHRVIASNPGNGGGEAVLDLVVQNCTVSVRIVTPASNVSNYPPNGFAYLSVSLVGELRDALGAPLSPVGYTFEWYTDRGDVQPGLPATGAQLLGTGLSTTGQFYGAPGQVSTNHRVTLVVKQAGTIVGTSLIRLVTVLELI